jgi:sortase (surface protein transpeptidase)
VSKGPVPRRDRQRTPFRSALVLAGIGLLAVGGTIGLDRGPRRLNVQAQEQRLLPAPVAEQRFGPARPPVRVEPAVEHRRVPQLRRRHEPRPVRISIPAIGVSAPVIPLGQNPDHTVAVPTSFSDAGWFKPGPKPGEAGAALIVGHVDSKSGPGVFYHLPALEHGDRILIRLADQRTLRFVVTSSRDVSKHSFPTQLVFAPTRRPTLRLVTCGGRFDESTGHYLDNYIVFAWLVGRQ